MDASSPLAAIRPRHLFGQDMFGVENSLPLAHERFGSGLTNFQQRLFPKSKQDYFNLDPIRGSSPTASLAADLSQNFRINEARLVCSCSGADFVHGSNPVC
jgi:M-phase inducer tyrosine phosphatase